MEEARPLVRLCALCYGVRAAVLGQRVEAAGGRSQVSRFHGSGRPLLRTESGVRVGAPARRGAQGRPHCGGGETASPSSGLQEDGLRANACFVAAKFPLG